METLSLQARIAALGKLGQWILEKEERLEQAMRRSEIENSWFTQENIQRSLNAIAAEFLDPEKLNAWAAQYPVEGVSPCRVGLIMAGNIPLVGFHDWLCVFMAGHTAVVKLSDKDKYLLPALLQALAAIEPASAAYTHFVGAEAPLRDFDAVIATGSNNTARYFEEYFGKYPHIIRRNRNSVAILSGQETDAELLALGADIVSYFGLGCRNVSKLYVPHGYNFEHLMEVLHEYREISMHNKWKNNFDYNFTLFILNKIHHYNNGCLLLTENSALQSRIASLNYEYYNDLYELEASLQSIADQIQCIVSAVSLPSLNTLAFGDTQHPGLKDYPDGVDVMQFLCNL
ncbi:MAG: acyl-CoA reductase [Chitinophagales bacterium]|nr:acyl-CoA reductase [Chitinophagales bacterium]